MTHVTTSISEAAAKIRDLINERPQSPDQSEIEAIIAGVGGGTVRWAMTTFPKVEQWLALRREHCERMRQAQGDDAITAELLRFDAVFRDLLRTEARTAEDIVLLAEITVFCCDPGLLGTVYPDDLVAKVESGPMDEVSHACLVRAVLNVLGGQADAERRARELEFQRLARKERLPAT